MTTVADRAGARFGQAEYVMVPFPVPEAGDTPSHVAAPTLTVQLQSARVVTVTVPLPPNVPIDPDVGDIANTHGVLASCTTENDCPPIATVPCLCAPAFAAATT